VELCLGVISGHIRSYAAVCQESCYAMMSQCAILLIDVTRSGRPRTARSHIRVERRRLRPGLLSGRDVRRASPGSGNSPRPTCRLRCSRSPSSRPPCCAMWREPCAFRQDRRSPILAAGMADQGCGWRGRPAFRRWGWTSRPSRSIRLPARLRIDWPRLLRGAGFGDVGVEAQPEWHDLYTRTYRAAIDLRDPHDDSGLASLQDEARRRLPEAGPTRRVVVTATVPRLAQ
jgi:hypothetical protein